MIKKLNTLIHVTILILIDGFLQYELIKFKKARTGVTILILIDGFLQFSRRKWLEKPWIVTILILIDGFLQYDYLNGINTVIKESQSLF